MFLGSVAIQPRPGTNLNRFTNSVFQSKCPQPVTFAWRESYRQSKRGYEFRARYGWADGEPAMGNHAATNNPGSLRPQFRVIEVQAQHGRAQAVPVILMLNKE
jgi:hypothetical protein